MELHRDGSGGNTLLPSRVELHSEQRADREREEKDGDEEGVLRPARWQAITPPRKELRQPCRDVVVRSEDGSSHFIHARAEEAGPSDRFRRAAHALRVGFCIIANFGTIVQDAVAENLPRDRVEDRGDFALVRLGR